MTPFEVLNAIEQTRRKTSLVGPGIEIVRELLALERKLSAIITEYLTHG